MSSAPPLGRGDVHVWRASVDAHASQEARFQLLLDRRERERAARYRFDADRLRYVVAHGMLRTVLAWYAGADPRALEFEAGEFGKPVLAAPRATPLRPPSFNLSHAGDVVLVAVSRQRAVGVDVERWDDRVARDMTPPPFSAAERDALARVAPEARVAAFFACWSRKEAYLKATGEGLSRGLDHFDVDPFSDVGSVTDRLGPGAASAWEVRDLQLERGYSGAVVAEGRGWDVRRMTWSQAAH